MIGFWELEMRMFTGALEGCLSAPNLYGFLLFSVCKQACPHRSSSSLCMIDSLQVSSEDHRLCFAHVIGRCKDDFRLFDHASLGTPVFAVR